MQLKIERVISPLRVAAVAVTSAAWFSMPHPTTSIAWLARAIIVAVSAYAALDVLLVFKLPRFASRRQSAATLLDFIFTALWIYATGGPSSSFLALALLGAVAAPLRNPPVISIATAAAYALMIVTIAGTQHWFEAAYVLAAGLGLTAWTALTYRDRRNSLRDDLTGCFSREYATFRLNDVFDRGQFPAAVAVVDLDGFKKINDTFGHAAGDAVLVQAVRAIASAIRQGDLLARSGGDEFVLILPHTSAGAARAVAERVRDAVKITRFRARRDRPPIRLTASIGVALAENAAADRVDLVTRADDCLYAAKQGGRDKVEM